MGRRRAHAHRGVHVWKGESPLATGRAEIGEAREVIVDLIEVRLKSQRENRVGVVRVDEVVGNDVRWLAKPFSGEVCEDLWQGKPHPFFISHFTGCFHDQGGVIGWSDGEAGILWFADAVESAIPEVSVECIHAARFAHQKRVNRHRLEVEMTGGLADFLRRLRVQQLDELWQWQRGNEMSGRMYDRADLDAGDAIFFIKDAGHWRVREKFRTAIRQRTGEATRERLCAVAGIVERLETKCALDGVAGFGEVEFFEKVFEHIDRREPRHLPTDKLSGKLLRVNPPVAVGEVLEEKLVKRRSIQLDQCRLCIGTEWTRAKARFQLGEEKTDQAAAECERWDASENVASAQWIMIEATAPFDVGIQWNFDAFAAHRLAAGGENFGIECMQHVHAEIIPISAESMASGESAELRFLFDDCDARPELKRGVRRVETANAAAENGQSGSGHAVGEGRNVDCFFQS